MATDAPPLLEWQVATVTAITPETQQTKTLTLALPQLDAPPAGPAL